MAIDDDKLSGVDVASLRMIRELVVDPVLKAMEIRFQAVEENIKDLREDYKDGARDNAAILRTIADPETGYVPRAQIDLIEHTMEIRFTTVYRTMGASLTALLAIITIVLGVLKLH